MPRLRVFSMAVLLLGTCGFVRTARADLTVSGSTSGAFSGTWNKLDFTGATFGPTSGPDLTLGSFTLHNGTVNSYNGTFTLTVTFTQPSGASGQPVAATLSGSVKGGEGYVNLAFGSPGHFTFSGGAFDLAVHNLTLNLEKTGPPLTSASLIGTISTSVPESFLVWLCAPACMGVLRFARRLRGGRELS